MSGFRNVLKEGTVLNGTHCDFTIVRAEDQDGFGVNYIATGLNRDIPEARRKNDPNINKPQRYNVREFFMFHCSTRDDDGVKIVTPDDSKSTVNEFREVFNTAIPWFIEASDGVDALVQIVDFFEANGTSYYVTEFLDGPNFLDYVKSKGKLTLEESRKALLPIFMAVRHLHTRHMLHTDLSPHCIVICRNPDGSMRPVLTHHYGCKPFVDRAEAAWSLPPVTCPEGYAPIEQYGEMDKFLPQTNVYSLAATLVYALSGTEPPTASEVTDDTISSILSDHVPQKFIDELTKAMKPDWHDRHSNTHELRIALLNALDEVNEQARIAEENAHPERKRRRNIVRIVWMTLLVAALLMLIGLVSMG